MFSRFFPIFKKDLIKIFFTMSMRNFPKIPKIILRKSCEQVKDTKNEKVSFLYKCLRSGSIATQVGETFVQWGAGLFRTGDLQYLSVLAKLCRKTGKFFICLFFVYLSSPHDFLSMIFGILGKFGIGIRNKKNRSKYFSSKKN